MKRKTVNLPEVIKANPGCYARIDNDCWWLYRSNPDEIDFDEVDYDEWHAENQLACDSDELVPRLGDGGYGSGNCYGGDILQALAIIVGVKVGSV